MNIANKNNVFISLSVLAFSGLLQSFAPGANAGVERKTLFRLNLNGNHDTIADTGVRPVLWLEGVLGTAEVQTGSDIGKPAPAGKVAVYRCAFNQGRFDTFSSNDKNCEGGIAFSSSPHYLLNASNIPGTKALYRCNYQGDHFDTTQANCEGVGTREGILGYIFD